MARSASTEAGSAGKSPFVDEHGKLQTVSFSGSGWLLIFQLGVLDALRTLDLLSPRTVFGGASGGSLIACAAAADLPAATLVDRYLQMSQQCRERMRWLRGKAGVYLSHTLEGVVTEDMHQQLSGRAFVAVSYVHKLGRPELISHFHSREDLIQALIASCFVPLYINGRLFTHFRSRRAVDGGIPHLIPKDPEKLPNAVHVCPFPRSVTRITRDTVHIGPDLQDRIKLNMRRSVLMAFRPPTTTEGHALYQAGHMSAVAFAKGEDLIHPANHYHHDHPNDDKNDGASSSPSDA